VPEPVENLDLMIDDYLDGRMPSEQRAHFEERISRDPNLRGKINSATRSVDLVQQALGWVTPGEDFDEKVNTKIVSITQSGQNLRPFDAASDRSLTSEDPDARLLEDPDASREKQRLTIIGIIAAVLFLAAALTITLSIARGVQKPAPIPTKR